MVLHHLVYQIARFLYDWLSMAHASFHQQICPIYSSYYIFINFILKYKVLHHTSLIKTRPLLEKSYKVPIRYCTTHLYIYTPINAANTKASSVNLHFSANTKGNFWVVGLIMAQHTPADCYKVQIRHHDNANYAIFM